MCSSLTIFMFTTSLIQVKMVGLINKVTTIIIILSIIILIVTFKREITLWKSTFFQVHIQYGVSMSQWFMEKITYSPFHPKFRVVDPDRLETIIQLLRFARSTLKRIPKLENTKPNYTMHYLLSEIMKSPKKYCFISWRTGSWKSKEIA